jgi:uncharacterized protein with NAD-binding domain and iron-sulfur cluster
MNSGLYPQKHVIIIGGGIAGLTTAHHLMQVNQSARKLQSSKGKIQHDIFKITILEKDPVYIGGKARSINYQPEWEKDTHNKFNFLPAEHGFRFFPGFYVNLFKVLKEIKISGKPGIKNVFDYLTKTECYLLTIDPKLIDGTNNKREPAEIPVKTAFFDFFGSIMAIALQAKHLVTNLTSEGKVQIAKSMSSFILSSRLREAVEYERISWTEYLDMSNTAYGTDYKYLLANGLTRNLAAAKAEKTSSRTGGTAFLKLIAEILSPTGTASRILTGPTNETWLIYWKAQLEEQGVKIVMGEQLKCIHNNKTEVTKLVTLSNGHKKEYISNNLPKKSDQETFDYVLLATPVEVTAGFLKQEICKCDNPKPDASIARLTDIDTSLRTIQQLKDSVEWMSGLVFYLNEEIVLPHGHVNFMDSQWAITGIFQTPFWKEEFAIKNFGNGKIATVFSTIMSSWDNPNCTDYTKPYEKRKANEMMPDEVIQTAWNQIKNGLAYRVGEEYKQLTDDMLYTDDPEHPLKYVYFDNSITVRDKGILLQEINHFFDRLNALTIKVTGNTSVQAAHYEDFEQAYIAYKLARNNNPLTASLKTVVMLHAEFPLLVNTVNTYPLRPCSYTGVENLFLAGDYIRTEVDLATMEGACESGKKAVNSIVNQYKMDIAQRTKGQTAPRNIDIHGPEVLLRKKQEVVFGFYLIIVFLLLDLPFFIAVLRGGHYLPYPGAAVINTALIIFFTVAFFLAQYWKLFLKRTLIVAGTLIAMGFISKWLALAFYSLIAFFLIAVFIIVPLHKFIDAIRFRKGYRFSFFKIGPS